MTSNRYLVQISFRKYESTLAQSIYWDILDFCESFSFRVRHHRAYRNKNIFLIFLESDTLNCDLLEVLFDKVISMYSEITHDDIGVQIKMLNWIEEATTLGGRLDM